MAGEQTNFTLGLDQNWCKIKQTSSGLENNTIIIGHPSHAPTGHSLVLVRPRPPLLTAVVASPSVLPYLCDPIHRWPTPCGACPLLIDSSLLPWSFSPMGSDKISRCLALAPVDRRPSWCASSSPSSWRSAPLICSLISVCLLLVSPMVMADLLLYVFIFVSLQLPDSKNLCQAPPCPPPSSCSVVDW